MEEQIILQTPLTQEDRAKMQWLQEQLKWKCYNQETSGEFRVSVNTLERTHSLYMPTDTSLFPGIETYLLELARCYYGEHNDPVFGNVHLDEGVNPEKAELLSTVLTLSQRWYTGLFCMDNFPTMWENLLKRGLDEIKQDDATMQEDLGRYLACALHCAWSAWFHSTSTETFLSGKLQKTANIFLAHDPRQCNAPSLSSLANSLLESFSSLSVQYTAYTEKKDTPVRWIVWQEAT